MKMDYAINLLRDKRFAVCLTHDVDRIRKTYQHMTCLIKKWQLPDISSIIGYKNPYWNFEKIMDIEDKAGVRSTFFFLDEKWRLPLTLKDFKLYCGRYRINEKNVRNIINRLDAGGWEIGVHGSYNSYQDLDLLKKEKNRLEEILGHEVLGVRQHYLNLGEKTWAIQAKAGFKYDSSFGLTRDIGFKNDQYHPFKPLAECKDFKVIPLAMMDCALMAKKDITKEYTKIIDLAEKNQGLLVLNWHNRVFNEKEFPGYSTVYEEIIQECLDRGALFSTLGVISK